MGMFDTVRCNYPLPKRPEWAKDFQTKDLPCNLDYYTIDAGGNLMSTGGTGPDGEIEEYTEIALVRYTGSLYFYEYTVEGMCAYYANFEDGRLVRVRLEHLKTK